jgi:hypothetical protein
LLNNALQEQKLLGDPEFKPKLQQELKLKEELEYKQNFKPKELKEQLF